MLQRWIVAKAWTHTSISIDVDLLILDLMLPGEHGLSIAQRLKKRRSTDHYCLRAGR